MGALIEVSSARCAATLVAALLVHLFPRGEDTEKLAEAERRLLG
jgi:hypothetical protein